MGRLCYSAISSLDGYVADDEGRFDWAAPDAEVHAFVNDLERPIGTYWLGRRMYEVMAVWDTMGDGDDEPVITDFAALWRAAEKVVFSRTLSEVTTRRTTLRHEVDVAGLRSELAAAPHDVSVGGPTLAGELLRAGLVDEVHHLVVPVLVGGGTPVYPAEVFAQLRLEDQRRFDNGTVYHRYVVRP